MTEYHATCPERTPVGDLLRRVISSPQLIGITAFLATFIDGSLYGVLVPVLPYSLVEIFKVPEKDVQFYLSTTLVTFGLSNALASPCMALACSAYSSVTRASSMKLPYLSAQFLAFSSTVILYLSEDIKMLIFARCLQGITASLIYISSIGMVIENIDQAHRGLWIGFALSGLSTSLVISPALGGWLYGHGGYDAVFGILFALVALATALRLILRDRRATPQRDQITCSRDGSQGGLSQCLDRPVPLPYNQEDNHGTASTDEQTPLLGEHEREKNLWIWLAAQVHTMFFISKHPRLRTALFGGFVHTTIIASFDAILPLMVQRTYHWESSLTGTIFLAIALPSLLSPVAGAISDRIGARSTALLGFMLSFCGILPMALVANNSPSAVAALCCLLVLTGTGLTLVLSPLATDVSTIADDLAAENPKMFKGNEAFALTFSTFNIGLGFAVAAGPCFSGLLYRSTSWEVTMFALAGLCAIASMFVFQFTGSGASTVGQKS